MHLCNPGIVDLPDNDLCCFRYQSLVGTIAKKFTKRRHKSGVCDTDETEKATVDKQGKDDIVMKTKKLKVQKKFLKPEAD